MVLSNRAETRSMAGIWNQAPEQRLQNLRNHLDEYVECLTLEVNLNMSAHTMEYIANIIFQTKNSYTFESGKKH